MNAKWFHNSPPGLGLKLFRFVITLWFTHLLTFCLFQYLPGAEFSRLGWGAADPAFAKTIRESLGSDLPFHTKYFGHLKRLLAGDLGESLSSKQPVFQILTKRFKTSLPYLVSAVVVVTSIYILSALWLCSDRWNRFQKGAIFLMGGIYLPQFVGAVLFYFIWHSLENSSYPFTMSPIFQGLFVTAAISIMPSALIFHLAGHASQKYAQAEFVRTYRAIGMSDFRIRTRIFRNVVIETNNAWSRMIVLLMTGTCFVEMVFGVNGIGKLFIDSLRQSDFPVMQGWILFVSCIAFLPQIVGFEK